MASKQLGKLRQWGREVISSKEKTVVTEEFKQLEQDVDLRRAGIERLHEACTEYHGYLHKKKEYANVEEGVKMLPVDALGAVMMSHGEEFGDDSAFGQCLIKFGRAHCKIATLQETYALTLRDTYLATLEASLGELSDYATQRKKLDSRRLAYDAAMVKSSKAKKEKEVKEAEEELSKAKLRYEETSTDVQARMHTIQEKEVQQLRDLSEFLSTEVRFAEQYLDVLRDAQDEWFDESAIKHTDTPRRKTAPHAFAFGRSTPSISSTSKTSASARPSSVSSTPGTTPPDEGERDAEYGFGVKRRPSPANTPRPSSRNSTTSVGTAHTSRHRRGSVGSEGGSMSKKTGVAGWASSAVSSLSGSGRGKKDGKKDKVGGKDRDKEAGRAFASLENDGDESELEDERRDDEFGAAKEEGLARSFGSSSLSKVLSQTPPTSLRPAPSSSNSSFNSFSGSASSETRVRVRALHDFSGSDDELSFVAGDEITVLADAQGGWSKGELAGRRGLFPTSYVESISIPTTRPRPPPSLPSRIAQRAAQNDAMSEDSASVLSADVHDVHVYDEPFGDHHLAKSPMAGEHEHEHERDVTTDEEDEMRGLFAPRASSSDAHADAHGGIEVGNAAGNDVFSSSMRPPPPALPQRKQSARKPPPPPPARRSTMSASSTPTLVSTSGGPYVSAPSSTANLSNFPAPPTAPRRSASRTRSTNALPKSIVDSPFDN